MVERLREFVAEHGLVPEGARVLVGFSGGADSSCLLHLMQRAGFDLVAAHLHHGQRSEADADEAHCVRFAESLGIPFVSGRADVPGLARDRKIGIEEAGREARYAFFEEAAAQTGCMRIATAHTRSDVAETILLNLTRGCGPAGLVGIPVENGSVVRPLLWASRAETEAYCKELGIETITDTGNDDLGFRRVRMRQRILPELSLINNKVEENIVKMGQIVEEENRFLDGAAAAALERAEIPLNGQLRFLTLDREVALARESVRHLPEALRRRAIRLVASVLGGELDHEQTVLASEGIAGSDKGSITAEGGQVVFAWDEERVHAQRMDESALPPRSVSVPGTTADGEGGWKLTLALDDSPCVMPRRDALRVPIDLDAFRGPLHLRAAKAGESMRPIGGTVSRKLSDLLSEAGLTLLARRRLPILCDIIGPLWAPGVCLDERARPAANGGRYLRAEFCPISEGMQSAETEWDPPTYANS
jgi:tRNA(Ile)-lysidine synthase